MKDNTDSFVFRHPEVSTIHFDERMYERFNYTLSTHIKNHFFEMIDSCDDDVELIADEDFPRCTFKIRYAFEIYIIVANLIDKCLITVWRSAESKKPKKIRKKGIKKVDKDELRKKKQWLERNNQQENEE